MILTGRSGKSNRLEKMETKTDIFKAKQIEETLTKLLWVTRLRWFTMIFLVTGTFIFFYPFHLARSFKLLLVLILAECLLNFIYWGLSWINFRRALPVAVINMLSIILDSFFMALFLYATRSLGRFSGLLFTIPVIVGGTVFPKRASLLNTGIISLIYYAFLNLALVNGRLYPGAMLQEQGSIFFFFLISFFVGYLSDQARINNHRLWQLQAEIIEKNNQIYQTQQEIIRTEKLATVTEIAVGLDEEINAPVTVILGILHFLKNKCIRKESLSAQELQEIKEGLKIISEQVRKIRATMKNLETINEKRVLIDDDKKN